jgi:hypothetical protein
MDTQSGASGASDLVRALEDAYAAIRARHEELRAVWIVVGDGQGRGGERRAGHFAAWRWSTHDGETRHELMVASQRLADGAAEVFETLLHEAAHALGNARGITDTSRGGRYHNGRFRDHAEELGLFVEQGDHGWSATALPAETAERYSEVIDALALAIDAYTGWREQDAPKKRQSQIKGWCSCGRVIRASATCWEEAPILCGECGDTFAADFAALREWREAQVARGVKDGRTITDPLVDGDGRTLRDILADGWDDSGEDEDLADDDDEGEDEVPF